MLGGGTVGIAGADRRGVALTDVVVVVIAELRGGEVVTVVVVAVTVGAIDVVRLVLVGNRFVGSLTDFRPGVMGRGTVGGRPVIGVCTVLAIEEVVVVEARTGVSVGGETWGREGVVELEREVGEISVAAPGRAAFFVGGGGGVLAGGSGARVLPFAEGTDKLEGGGLVIVRVGRASGIGIVKGVLGEFCRDKERVGGSVVGCTRSPPLGDGGADREPRADGVFRNSDAG